MKQSDFISVAMVAIIGTIVAFVACNALLGDPDKFTTSFKTVAPVEGQLIKPNPEIFNYDAINPTVEVYVGTCEDVDRDGVLSKKEKEACGEKVNGDEEEEEDTDDIEDKSGTNEGDQSQPEAE